MSGAFSLRQALGGHDLAGAAVPHDIHVNAGAPHSFFDRGCEEWAEQCRDAWRRVMEFAAT